MTSTRSRLLCLLALVTASPLAAQNGRSDPLTERIRAQAILVQAVAGARQTEAEARRVRALARREEIANSVAYVKAHWEKKAIFRAERMKLHKNFVEKQRERNARTWERLSEFPELSRGAIHDGRALTFLLNRLDTTVLAYRFSVGNADDDDAALGEQFTLPAEVLHKLRLARKQEGANVTVFRADEGVPLQLDWWPAALRGDEFESHRSEMLAARKHAVELFTSGASLSERDKAIKALMAALDELESAFVAHYSQRSNLDPRRLRRTASMEAYAEFRTAHRFLKSLAGEIGQLSRTGQADAFDGDKKFAGENLVDLLTFMAQNGLTFAPARPGEEDAYHYVFRMLRDLYLSVSETTDVESDLTGKPNPNAPPEPLPR